VQVRPVAHPRLSPAATATATATATAGQADSGGRSGCLDVLYRFISACRFGAGQIYPFLFKACVAVQPPPPRPPHLPRDA
jgi:hypothetical protein